MTATVAQSVPRWGPGGMKFLVAAGVIAGEALLAAAVAAGVAAQWRLLARRGGPPASWPLARQWAGEYFRGHPLLLAWWIPPAAIDPLQFPRAVNAAVFLASGNRAWISAPGVGAVATAGGAWPALGGGAFMAAATVYVCVAAVAVARIDARLVARRAMRQAQAGRP